MFLNGSLCITRKLPPERELPKEALKYEEIVELLVDAQIMNIMSNLGPYYPMLVKEFILNIPKDFNIVGSKDFWKVHIRGWCFGFYPFIINEYLKRGKMIIVDRILPLKSIS